MIKTKMNKDKIRFLIVASHRRSGTHWVIDSVLNNFEDVEYVYLTLERLLPYHNKHLSISKFRKHLNNKKIKIIKTHAGGDFAIFKKFPDIYDFIKNEVIPYSKIIHVTRDGKDILNSLFYYLKVIGITYPTFSEFIKSKNNFDNIYSEKNRVEFLKMHLDSWGKVENKLDLDYSELAVNYSGAISRISGFLSMDSKRPIKKVDLKKYNKLSRGFRRIFPALFTSTAVLPREGKVGGWTKNFTDFDLDFYNSIMKSE